MPTFDVSPIAREVIGTGIRAPFAFSIGRNVRSVTSSNGLDKIHQSIRDILLTRPGERVMQPEYGSRLFDIVFEPADTLTNRILFAYTAGAIGRWEKRVRVTSTEFYEDPNNANLLGIVVNFTVLATHEEGSFVFPYERKAAPMGSTVTGFESERIFTRGTILPVSSIPSNVGSKV